MLTERARCLRLNAGLPKSFWAEEVSMACYLINISQRASLVGKVAKEVWTGNVVDFGHLRIFGCLTYVHVPSDKRSKLYTKSKKCIFLGYKKGVKGYKFWDPDDKKVVNSTDAVFHGQFMLQRNQEKVQMKLEHIPIAAILERIESSNPTSGGSSTIDL